MTEIDSELKRRTAAVENREIQAQNLQEELNRQQSVIDEKQATLDHALLQAQSKGDAIIDEAKQTLAAAKQKAAEILSGIAAEESCVVAGRSGFYVFRNHPNHISILIQATMPFRVERVMRKQNMTEEEARKTIEKVDKMRENYVHEYTKTSRYDTRNYDLVISADGKTEDEIVDIIMKFIG